jgi:type II secretory pathway pseudopilin PulG
MVILVILVTIMTIGTAAAFPLWTSVSQREKEEELIFRGLQYAEAIRCFQRRFQRLPIKLEELEKVKPRCIRQLYPDPMTEDGEWGLIYAGGPGTQVNPGQAEGVPGDQNRQDALNRALPNRGQRGRQGNGLPQSNGERQRGGLGPIAGVYSKAEGDSIKIFMGKTRYDQWAFTAELVSGIASLPDRPPLVPSGDTLGRPFPEGIQPQIAFQLPNQNGNPPSGLGQQGQNGGVQRPTRGQGRQGFGVPVPAQGRNQGANGLNPQQQRQGGAFGGQQRRGAGGFGGGQRNPVGGGDG